MRRVQRRSARRTLVAENWSRPRSAHQRRFRNLGAPLAAAALAAAPIAEVLRLAWLGDSGLWPHLAATILPSALLDTLLLLAGVGLVVALVGVGTAWLVAAYSFPGRGLLSGLLVLPLAMPTYLTAYAYVDLLDGLGPFQSALRDLFGFTRRTQYWFPEIRSLGGAVLVLGFVLYPYVYLPARAMFATQSASLVEAARTMGVGGWGLARRVAIPLARPALAAGGALALLEVLNDIGASEHLGVRTLTIAIYTTWLNRGSLAGAAQIACVMLAFVLVCLWIEARGRSAQGYAQSARKPRSATPVKLDRRAGWLACAACALPVLLGFLLPLLTILRAAGESGIDVAALASAAIHTLVFASAATLLAVALGFLTASCVRRARSPLTALLARVAGLGYALPGTVLALGLLTIIASLDNAIADAVRGLTGASPGLVFSGFGAAIVIAYLVRFLTIAIGGAEAGLARVSPRVDDAATLLGLTGNQMRWRVHWPMTRGAVAAAALLFFVDCMKELPATLLLRPINVETLATLVYGHASRGSYEDGAPAALAIVLLSLVPAVRAARAIDQAGGKDVRQTHGRDG